MLVWGGFDSDGFSSTGGCYDPVNDAWSAMSTINAPTGRNGHSMIWSGSEMIVWGGSNVVHSGGVSSNYFNDGGRYNPLTNSWTSISLTNAPATREAHTAVWTGSKMIIYGGFAVTHRADGKSYDPENNTWSSITTTNQPPARSSHAAVWTGGEMIIFGGFNSTWATLNETYTYMPPKLIFLYQRP
jgi:N-acetylneuraminic acid mutarotase